MNMKVVVGIAAAVLIALGVWLSLTYGETSKALPGTPTGWRTYLDPQFGIAHPADYTMDEDHEYALGPDKAIKGTRFVIPASLAEGTNLSPDTYISVETLPGAINSCSAEIYLATSTSAGFVDDEKGHRFSIATSSGAAAGNRYEEWVYATPVANGCIAVRYFIHSTAVGNYPAGQVTEFDRQALISQFDAIRQTLTIRNEQ